MAKTTAPLLSFDASGQIAKSLVFSKWKGRAYARQYVKPANPKTVAQQAVRNTWKWLNAVWPYMPAAVIPSWQLFAKNSQFTERNGWMKVNQPLLKGDSNIDDILLTTAAGGGLASGGAAFAAVSQGVDVDLTAPTLPSGWTITASWAVAMENVDPSTDTIPDVGSATDASSPYEMTISGLKASTEYQVAGWFEYTKPNGDKAYGAGDQQLVTTLA